MLGVVEMLEWGRNREMERERRGWQRGGCYRVEIRKTLVGESDEMQG